MTEADLITVLIADDHPVVREGLAAMINRRPDMEVVAEASNGREAVEQFLIHRPGVALLDLRMPEMDGVGAIRAIRARVSAARIIVLTTFDGDEDIHRGMQAGAKAYVLKDSSREEVLDCIRRVWWGGTYIPPQVAAKLASHLSAEELTERETEVLRLAAEGNANKEIGARLGVTEGTVKTHVHTILKKLEAADRTHAVTLALKRGILRLS